MKVKKQKNKKFPLYPYLLQCSRPCPTVSQSQLDAPVTKDAQHLCLTQTPPLADDSHEIQDFL